METVRRAEEERPACGAADLVAARVDEDGRQAFEASEEAARRTEERRLQDAAEEAAGLEASEVAILRCGARVLGSSRWECFWCVGIDADLSQWPRRWRQEALPWRVRVRCHACGERPVVLMARALAEPW